MFSITPFDRFRNTFLLPNILFISLAFLLGGCGGSGSSGDGTAESDDSSENDDVTSALTVTSASDVMQIHLRWSGAEKVDILYSSEPQCDWDNYSLCSDGAILTGVEGSETSIGAVENGLDTDKGWYFVVEADGRRSSQVSGKAAQPSFGGYQLYALETDGENLYAGGNFARVALATGGVAMFDSRQSNTLTGVLPYLDGIVHAIAKDESGGWVVGGEFEEVGGRARKNLVKLRADGTVEPDWRVDVNGPVNALAVEGDRLYVGGDFTELTVDQDALYNRTNLAAITLSTGLPASGWNPTISDPVLAVETTESLVYAGGEFTLINGASRDHLAALTVEDGQLDSGWTPGANGPVNALFHDSGAVFAGGLFTQVGDDSRENIVKIDAISGGIDSEWNPGAGEEVLAISMWSNQVLVGGIAGAGWPVPFLIIDRNDGSHDPDWNLALSSVAATDNRSIDVVGDDIYVANGRSIVKLNAQEKTESSWDASITTSFVDGPMAVAAGDSSLMVGGEFIEAGGERYNSIAVMDLDTGILQPPLEGAAGPVETLLYHDGRLYAGGSMNYNPDQQALAAFDLDTLSRDEDWTATANESRFVYGLATDGSRLYTGGRFSKVDQADVVRVTGFELLSGDLSDFANPPAPDDTVNTLAVVGDQLLLGGRFETVDGQAQTHLASIDITDGTLLNGVSLDADDSVNSIHRSSDTTVYVGGRFRNIGGEGLSGAARLRLNNGTLELDKNWEPNQSSVESVATSGNRVFLGRAIALGGDEGLLAFSVYGSGDRIADWDPAPDNTTNALLYHEGKLFVGGWFQELGGKHRNLFGVLDAESGEVLW